MTVIQLKSLNKIVLDLKQYFLLENETNINNLSPLGYSRKKPKNFFTLPWKFHTKQSSIPGYSAKLCQLYFLEILRLKSKIPGNSTLFFLGHSWKPHVISLLPLKIPYLHHPPPCSFFFSGIAHCCYAYVTKYLLFQASNSDFIHFPSNPDLHFQIFFGLFVGYLLDQLDILFLIYDNQFSFLCTTFVYLK